MTCETGPCVIVAELLDGLADEALLDSFPCAGASIDALAGWLPIFRRVAMPKASAITTCGA